jgi:N-acetylated-alpha-linked acidic dipeptidase
MIASFFTPGDRALMQPPVAEVTSRGRAPRGVRPWTLLLSTVVPLAAASAAGESSPGLFGFTAQEAAAQRSLEQRFDAQLNPAELRDWLKNLASGPNQVGSPHDKANAEFVRDLFRQWGWQAQIEVFDVLYPTLKQHSLELVAPTHFTASLTEPPVAGDSTSGVAGIMPPYNVYGADGEVTGDLVYLNFGMAKDYQELARRGIDVKGKIVIARYGSGWRGLKPKLAQEHGAIGCIIYSDPHEDGYAEGDVYPRGGWRPPEGVQRGSVLDITRYSGDPLTPGVGATRDAKRLAVSDAQTILKIPVLPISYADAQPLLAALGGPVAPPKWRGALPITYHLGPGPAKVHVAIRSDWSLKPLYDVIARIPGRETPDAWVVRGNHRDGWVFGAWDPLSGQVAMLAEAKAIGALVKSGWRPRRTLVYASWDGEEPGTPRLDRMGRDARGGAQPQRGPVPQLRHQHARLPRRRRQPFAAASGQRSRRWREGSRDRGEHPGAAAGPHLDAELRARAGGRGRG